MPYKLTVNGRPATVDAPADMPLLWVIPLHNFFFLPSMKLIEKWREGSRWVRRHDEPQTAYQRLLAHGDLRPKARRQLQDQFEALDPFVLATQVERRLKPILGAALAE